MKFYIRTIFFGVIFTLFTHSALYAQWVKLDFPAYDDPTSEQHCVIGKYFFSAFTGSTKELYRTSDLGNSWQLDTIGLPTNGGFGITALVADDSVLIASVFDNFQGGKQGIYRSTDFGGSWHQSTGVLNGIAFRGNVNSFVSFGNAIYGCGEVSVIRSTDHGQSWENIGTGLPPFVNNMYYLKLMVQANSLNLMIVGSGVYQSVDSGRTWKSTFSTGIQLYDLTSLDTNLYLAADILFHSTQHSTQWSELNVPNQDIGIRSLATYNNSLFAAGTRISLSSNHGIDWVDITDTIKSQLKIPLAIYNNHLFAFTTNGVWRRPLSDFTSVVENSIKSSNIIFNQNFPNPFFERTTIPFYCKKPESIRYEIFDILGRKISAGNRRFYESGENQIVVTGEDLPNGLLEVLFYNTNGLVKNIFIQKD